MKVTFSFFSLVFLSVLGNSNMFAGKCPDLIIKRSKTAKKQILYMAEGRAYFLELVHLNNGTDIEYKVVDEIVNPHKTIIVQFYYGGYSTESGSIFEIRHPFKKELEFDLRLYSTYNRTGDNLKMQPVKLYYKKLWRAYYFTHLELLNLRLKQN